MEKGSLDLFWLWRVSPLWAAACAIMLLQCVHSLNEEGKLLLIWKQEYLEDQDDSLSNWNASDSTPCFWNGGTCTQGSVSGLDMSPTPFCNLAGNIHGLAFGKWLNPLLTLLYE